MESNIFSILIDISSYVGMSTQPGPLAVVPAFKTTVEDDGFTGGGVGRGVVGAGGVGVKIKTGGGVGGGVGGEV